MFGSQDGLNQEGLKDASVDMTGRSIGIRGIPLTHVIRETAEVPDEKPEIEGADPENVDAV